MRQNGGVRKQRGRWLGLWYEEGIKKSKVLGLIKDSVKKSKALDLKELTKSEAREDVGKIIAELRTKGDPTRFGAFVEGPFFEFYARKWKASTLENNRQRIRTHLVSAFRDRAVGSFTRNELQDFLDAKAKEAIKKRGGRKRAVSKAALDQAPQDGRTEQEMAEKKKVKTLSFSVLDHLRWDLKQIFDFAISEGLLARNPALLLFTPKDAQLKKPVRRVMTLNDIRNALGCLEQREQLIAKLAILVGMRPSEIFALTWGRVAVNFADVMQRVYRGLVDTPKTQASVREAALTDGLLRDLQSWRSLAGLSGPEDWVFPSERLYALASPTKPTPLRKDNVWHRNMLPKLKAVGLEWCNFQVMRRTHATLMRELKADPKLVATQMGHSVDVSLNVYAQSPVEGRAQLVNALEGLLVH